MMYHFNGEYYPTPENVILEMIGTENIEGKNILEPSAGTGRIVEACKARRANVIACEKDKDLQKVLAGKCKLIAEDFLTVTSEQVSHVHYIVMNPPFSRGAEHILHAYEIAPAGCKVIALCNSATVENRYDNRRQRLFTILQEHGNEQKLGNCFSEADRETEVEVSLLRLLKPGSGYEQEFSGFFMEEEQEEQANGLIKYNVIRDLVNRYVESVKIFDQQAETAVRLNELQEGYFDGDGKQSVSISFARGEMPVMRNEFKKDMQRQGWKWIFNKLDMQQYSTKGLKEDLNKFIETQSQVPFTMKNIYKMLEIVIGTQGSRMDKAMLEAFDHVTKHHDDNRYSVPGWKTNSAYLLTKRFILPHVITADFSGGMRSNFSYNWTEGIDDLHKALCFLMGIPFENTDGNFSYFFGGGGKHNFGELYTWGFFRVRGYRKGTCHFEFLDEKVWAKFNQRIAKLKGYPLPEFKTETAYQRRQSGHKERAEGMAYKA